MSEKETPAVIPHSIPEDFKNALAADAVALERWQDITPLAQNEWICWVEDAKKAETRQNRIIRVCVDLKAGKRRPCCWPGCTHREKMGRN
jgi:uncharacterized protein YdeI (YjbR/CyaY-like superfamily)